MMFAAAAMVLSSATFRPNATMPQSAVYKQCGGANLSPELHWSNAPRGTRSFAVIAYDPDAAGGWYHWVAYNIPSNVNRLRQGARLPLGELGATSFRQMAYGGPCPPPGRFHHYIFTVYALNVARIGRPGLPGARVEAVLRRHVLGKGTLTGLYRR